MRNPVIRHKVCSYEGRLWVIDATAWKKSHTVIELRLVDGDDVCFAEMSQKEYLALNSALEEQEFVILPPVVVPPVKPKPLFPPPKPVKAAPPLTPDPYLDGIMNRRKV